MTLSGWIRTATMACSPLALRSARRNLGLWIKALGDPAGRKTAANLFDPAYYLETNEDVLRSGIHPFTHYLLRGFLEGRRPSKNFNNNHYQGLYEDVARAGLNPLLHYALFGRDEGRSPAPSRILVRETGASAAFDRIDNAWPTDLPLVTVVIPCFNYGRYLEEALRSVLTQTFRNFEVIIIEGGSTDGVTPGIVAEIETRRYENVRVFYRRDRCLAGDNRNFGISHARGRYICCLDADDLLKPTYLEITVFLAEAFGYDVVTSSCECFGDSDIKWLLEDPSFPAICAHNQIASAALYRRSVWVQAGGYRDWGLGHEHIPEDWDFWVRVLAHGYIGRSIREPLMRYRVHDSGLTATSETTREHQRETLRAANQHLLANPVLPPAGNAIEIAGRWTNLCTPEPNAPPAILVALPFITVGGAEQLVHHIAQGLSAKGLRVIIVTTTSLPDTVKTVPHRYDDITRHVYHLPRLLDDDEWPHFIRSLVLRYNVRSVLLVGSEFLYHQLPELTSQLPNLRVVDQLFNDKGHIVNNRHYSRFIHRTVVPSNSLANTLIERYGEDPSRIAVIPHGIDTRPAFWNREKAFEASGLPEHARNRILVSFFGRMSEEKSPRTFVKIAARLALRGDLYFVMTGEGPEWPAVKKLAASHRLKNSLYLPGFVRDQRPLMELSDIVVLTSSLDGMPLVVLEAAALCKPVVASLVGSLPEMVVDGESGYLCPIGDIEAFCSAIERLAGSESLRRTMGERGRRHIVAHFDLDAMIASYAEVLAADRQSKGVAV